MKRNIKKKGRRKEHFGPWDLLKQDREERKEMKNKGKEGVWADRRWRWEGVKRGRVAAADKLQARKQRRRRQ